MKTEELFALLESQGMFPVLVEEEGSRLGHPGLTMIGDLECFTKAVQALGEKVIFISARRLQEADFVHESEAEDEESGAPSFGPPQLIPLSTAYPEIEEFKTRLNQECAFTLSVYFKQSALHYCLAEAWWLEFQARREKAITALEERARTRKERLEAERERELERQRGRQQSLVEKLRACARSRRKPLSCKENAHFSHRLSEAWSRTGIFWKLPHGGTRRSAGCRQQPWR